MTPLFVIEIPGDIYHNSPNSMGGRHRMAVHKLEKRAMEDARNIWLLTGGPVAPGPVRVDIEVIRGKRMDQANIWAGLKGTMDGLFKNAITPDDSDKYVTLGAITQTTGKQYRLKECVRFSVYDNAAVTELFVRARQWAAILNTLDTVPRQQLWVQIVVPHVKKPDKKYPPALDPRESVTKVTFSRKPLKGGPDGYIWELERGFKVTVFYD